MTQPHPTTVDKDEKRKSVEELKPLMPEAFNGNLSLEVAFKEGYNTAINSLHPTTVDWEKEYDLKFTYSGIPAGMKTFIQEKVTRAYEKGYEEGRKK
jgi:hypothetical protein